uniref:Aprataxin and PNK-like factor n=1 Tax=Sus scrofa TaxID=9823 RepID=A0A8D1BRJ0_PIG
MSGGFELQPQDGGPRVALAPGETVIGRGPLLGITDKRVSRRHAILEVVDGQLRIKPIHTNPCFYQSSEKSQFLPLKTNLWCWLNPGDSFSLLVDKYIFRVFSTHSEMEMECTLRNSQMLDEDELNETPKSSSVDLPDEIPQPAPQLERGIEIVKTQTTMNSVSFLGESRDFSKQQPNPAQRKRILPAWMLTENLSDQNLSVAVISGDNNLIRESGKEEICKDKTQVNIKHQGRKRLISSGSSESISAEQDTGKKCKDADWEESVISSKEMPQSRFTNTLHNTEVNKVKTNTQRNETPVEELGEVSEQKITAKGTPNKVDKVRSCAESCSSAQGTSSLDESQRSHPESSSHPFNPETLHAEATRSVPQGSEENKLKRTSCMYGANCYRILSIFNTSVTLVIVIMEMYMSRVKMRLMSGLNVLMEHLVIEYWSAMMSCTLFRSKMQMCLFSRRIKTKYKALLRIMMSEIAACISSVSLNEGRVVKRNYSKEESPAQDRI